MHETALMRDLIAKILSIADVEGAGRVVGVRVCLGALSHMTPEHFRAHFADDARGTPAENAALEIETCADTTAPHARTILLESVEVE